MLLCLTIVHFLFDRTVLEKNLRLVMECVDELSQDSNKYFNYMRQAQKQNAAKEQYLDKRVRCFYLMLTVNELLAVYTLPVQL